MRYKVIQRGFWFFVLDTVFNRVVSQHENEQEATKTCNDKNQKQAIEETSYYNERWGK